MIQKYHKCKPFSYPMREVWLSTLYSWGNGGSERIIVMAGAHCGSSSGLWGHNISPGPPSSVLVQTLIYSLSLSVTANSPSHLPRSLELSMAFSSQSNMDWSHSPKPAWDFDLVSWWQLTPLQSVHMALISFHTPIPSYPFWVPPTVV